VWLFSSGLKEETESLIIATQDQEFNMHHHHRNNTKQPNDSKCRMCHKAEQHKKYIVAVYITLVLSEYTNRNNKVAGYIHWTICQHMGLQVTEEYYKRIPERVKTVIGTTIMWDVLVITDGTILANRPNIVQHDKKREDLPTDRYSHTR